MRTTKAPLVLLVDDDYDFREGLADFLRETCHIRIREAANALDALTWLEQMHADVAVVVSDHRMPGMKGRKLLDYIGTRWPHMRRVLLGTTTGRMIVDREYDDVIDKLTSPAVVAERICELAKAA